MSVLNQGITRYDRGNILGSGIFLQALNLQSGLLHGIFGTQQSTIGITLGGLSSQDALVSSVDGWVLVPMKHAVSV
jgi:hypothetical protein